VGLVAFDLVVGYLNRKAIAKQAFQKGGKGMLEGPMG
jgi:hypothetical protein